MPYRRKDSAAWWVSHTDRSGKRIRCATGTTDRKEAEALEAKWKLEEHQAVKWGVPPARTFDELMLAYMREVVKRSSERDRFSLRQLFPFFSGKEMQQLSPVHVRQYINIRRGQGIQAGTINKEIGLLSVAINYANREWEWKLPNPVEGRRLPESCRRIRWLSCSQAQSLIIAAGKLPRATYLIDFIVLGLNTGMRRGEMLGLEWQRVDLKAGLIYFGAEHQKNGKVGSVPLNDAAHGAIVSRARFKARHCPASQWVFCNRIGRPIRDIKKSFATACGIAQIEDLHPHDLRHTCAAWLVQAGVPIREVAELLRHSDIRVTMRYAHLAPENVRAAVLVLDGLGSRSGHVDQVRKLRGVG